jgi:hypothetical protein
MKRVVTAAATAILSSLAFAAGADAKINPGVQTDTGGAQCTANFVFTDGSSTYLGQAAHCSGTGEATDTNGCEAGVLPIGTQVKIEDSGNPGSFPVTGTIAYSSWNAMQAAGETDPDACAYNDLALIKLPAGADADPNVPFWGGPTGVATTAPAALSKVYSYGNSSLRQGIELLKPKRGMTLGASGNGWTRQLYTLTPGIPGDSGSAFLDAQGRAFGVLSTLALAPLPASNGVSDLGKMMAYARSHGVPGLQLVAGTTPFDGSRIL